jgi:hypothetical protein
MTREWIKRVAESPANARYHGAGGEKTMGASFDMSDTEGSRATRPDNPQVGESFGRILGAILIALGGLFLLVQTMVDPWRFAWPFFVIIPGVLFFVGAIYGGRTASGLAIPGSIITTTGLILLYQNTFDQWQTWAYVWALIGPTSVGFGIWLHGNLGDEPGARRVGLRLMEIGAVLFIAFFTFFELMLNLSGFAFGPVGRLIGPLALVAIGLYLLIRRGGQPSHAP